MEIEFVDRYSATGTPRPRLLTVCPGQCEGMGFYPLQDPHHDLADGDLVFSYREEYSREDLDAIAAMKAKDGVAEDGWYFITCPDCGGTGRQPWWKGLHRIPAAVRSGWKFWWWAVSNKEASRPGESLASRVWSATVIVFGFFEAFRRKGWV